MIRQPSDILLPSLEQALFGPTRQCPEIFMPPNPTENGDDGSMNEETEEKDDEKAAAEGEATETGGISNKVSSSAIDILYDSLDLGHWAEAAKEYDVPMAKLRKIASQGIPDEGSLRGIAWRVLLHYLPPEDIQESWNVHVPPKREFYRNLVEQYFQEPMEDGRHLRGQLTKTTRNRKMLSKKSSAASEDSETSNSILGPPKVEDLLPPKFKEQWKRSGITLDKMTTATSSPEADLNLNLNHLKVPAFDNDSPQEVFQDFLEDAMLLEEIRKDVSRTLSHLLFFLEPNDCLGLRRYAALERILFLWAKLNKGVRYVQGMNEIAGTIYYVLANDDNSEWANYAESDSYFLFHALMMDIRDVFVPDMDSHSTGIQGRIETMERLLEIHDPDVYAHLRKCGIDSHFYAYRWLTTLLSREFLLPDTIRLWDSMFASTHKDNFLRYVCVTMVMRIREDLLAGDFSANLRLLQRYPPANVDAILDTSRSLWMYETKIRTTCQKKGVTVDQALQTVAPPPNLIMAFGLKKGIAPNFKHRLEGARENLIGRAQRFLSAFKEETATVAVPAPELTPTSEPPSRPRFWNRARRNTEDSDTDLSNNQSTSVMNREADADAPSSDVNQKSQEAPASSGSTNATPRRKIWNRSPASRTPDCVPNQETNLHGATPLPTLQTSLSTSTNGSTPPAAAPNTSRWPLWKNRGWVSEARGNTTAAQVQDD